MLLTVAISIYTGVCRLRIDHWDKKDLTITQSSLYVAFTHYVCHILQNHIRLPMLSNFEIAFLRALHPRKPSSPSALLRFKCCIHLQSFYFYIPHERLKPGGHLHHIFLCTPSLAPLQRRCAESNSKDFSKDRSYGTAQTVTPSARRIYSDNFHSLTHPVGPPKSPDEGLSYSLCDTSLNGWCQIQCCNSCIVMLTLCIISQCVEYGIILPLGVLRVFMVILHQSVLKGQRT